MYRKRSESFRKMRKNSQSALLFLGWSANHFLLYPLLDVEAGAGFICVFVVAVELGYGEADAGECRELSVESRERADAG